MPLNQAAKPGVSTSDAAARPKFLLLYPKLLCTVRLELLYGNELWSGVLAAVQNSVAALQVP